MFYIIVGGIFSISGIRYTSLLKDFTCLRSGCTVEMESCEIWDAGFLKICSNCIKDSLGMLGRTLLSTTLLDAMMYGLH